MIDDNLFTFPVEQNLNIESNTINNVNPIYEYDLIFNGSEVHNYILHTNYKFWSLIGLQLSHVRAAKRCVCWNYTSYKVLIKYSEWRIFCCWAQLINILGIARFILRNMLLWRLVNAIMHFPSNFTNLSRFIISQAKAV